MTDNELKVIRQNIACPQFGDDHYGAWGALNISQRRTIYKMWDEINRQKAEEEALIAGQETLQRHIAEQKEEIERLNEKLKAMQAYIEQNKLEWSAVSFIEYYRKLKAEAIKEFAERLKSYLLLNKRGQMSVLSFEDIEKLVKEMVGDV